jgi:cyclase
MTVLLMESNYFKLHQLADGVFAAIAIPGSPAYSNAGIIDTGIHTLIFDTFNTHMAALDLRRAAKALTGRPGEFVINSHAHSDHWMGNQVFAAKASLIATLITQQAMNARLTDMRDLKRDPSALEAAIRDIEKQLQHTSNPQQRAHLAWSIVIQQHHLENLRSFKPTLPDQAFEGRVTFHGTSRKVTLSTPGPGHTNSDAILELPDDSIAFIGDLGFFQTHPYLGDSTPDQWIATLEKLAGDGFEKFVPGHGPLGTRKDLVQLRDYLLTLQELAATLVASGAQINDLSYQSPPVFSKDWAGYGRFEKSLLFLYNRELNQQAQRST